MFLFITAVIVTRPLNLSKYMADIKLVIDDFDRGETVSTSRLLV